MPRSRDFLCSCFFIAATAAHADTVYSLQGTFATSFTVSNGTTYTLPGGTLGGTITENSTDTGFSGIDATITRGGVTTYFTTITTQFKDIFSVYDTEATGAGAAGSLGLIFFANTTTPRGPNPLLLCTLAAPCGEVSETSGYTVIFTDNLMSGSSTLQATPVVTPEPSSLALLATGLIGLAKHARRQIRRR